MREEQFNRLSAIFLLEKTPFMLFCAHILKLPEKGETRSKSLGAFFEKFQKLHSTEKTEVGVAFIFSLDGT